MSEIESPCTNVCQLDEEDVCLGCGRTRDEIRAWKEADDDEKLAILSRAGRRTPGLLQD